jgi:hypothetical protein
VSKKPKPKGKKMLTPYEIAMLALQAVAAIGALIAAIRWW